MTLLRNLAISAIATLISSTLYFAMCAFALIGPASEGGAPAQGVLLFAVLITIGAILAWIFLTLARISWRTRDAVVRQHLFGWPIGIAGLFFAVLAIPAVVGGFISFIVVLLSCLFCGAAGCGAVALWLKLSYAKTT